MISALISALGALFSVVGKIFDWLYAAKLTDAGKVSEKLDALKGQVDAAQKAVETRLAIERAQQLDPNGLPDDDEFRRPDNE